MSLSTLPFDNTYAELPASFFARVKPSACSAPKIIQINTSLAKSIKLPNELMHLPLSAEFFSGNHLMGHSQPIAQAYAGHQFGHFVPQLGDGRAILLGELLDQDGQRKDIQLKGAGVTPFSRNGDGRSALGPVIREYIVSEAMHSLGIPSTRALAAVCTGDDVVRETLTPGGILTRVASSHIRIGTFQFFAARGDYPSVKRLADYCIDRHYPQLRDSKTPYIDFFKTVMERQARLIAQWMQVGFIHGVMNTDNMSICGETIDFGPCAFMEVFHPNTVFSAIDQQGRYAYANQGSMAQWNLARFIETLLPVINEDKPEEFIPEAEQMLEDFAQQFKQLWLEGMRNKCGLFDEKRKGDENIVHEWLDLLQKNHSDYTLSFRQLADRLTDHPTQPTSDALSAWTTLWLERVKSQDMPPASIVQRMNRINPLYIPRNHWVEAAIRDGVDNHDFTLMKELNHVLEKPFTEQSDKEAFSQPATEQERVTQTFCGT